MPLCKCCCCACSLCLESYPPPPSDATEGYNVCQGTSQLGPRDAIAQTAAQALVFAEEVKSVIGNLTEDPEVFTAGLVMYNEIMILRTKVLLVLHILLYIY